MVNSRHPRWEAHREHLQLIAQAALAAVNPYDAVRRFLQLDGESLRVGAKRYSMEQVRNIWVVGGGKAGVPMVEAVESVLQDCVSGGVVAIPEFPEQVPSKIRLIEAGHPLPTEGSVEAGRAIAELLGETHEMDLVLVLISGGGSTLLELPAEGLQLIDLQRVNDLLLRSGAPIQEINTVRRQLSMIKGGGIARFAAPAQVAALILSDVIGDQLDAIASGPTVISQTSIADALQVLEQYRLMSEVPRAVRKLLSRKFVENPVPSKPYPNVNNIIIGSNRIAAEAAAKHASDLGFRAVVLTTALQGEARLMGIMIANLVKALDRPLAQGKPLCMILGGETTVTVQGSGVGGRNQELALAAARELDGSKMVSLMTLATDGIDGPTPSAGAIIAGDTIARARVLALDPESHLDDNNSHAFFQSLQDTVVLGWTGTNVNDLVLICVYEE